jgi:hypothetical protein
MQSTLRGRDCCDCCDCCDCGCLGLITLVLVGVCECRSICIQPQGFDVAVLPILLECESQWDCLILRNRVHTDSHDIPRCASTCLGDSQQDLIAKSPDARRIILLHP